MAVAYNFPCLYVPRLGADQAIDRHIHTHTQNIAKVRHIPS